MDLITQNFLPYFLATLGVGSALILVVACLGFVAMFLDKKVIKNRR
jgi:hypothetical protein